jgi:small subunit ribosomal protein S28e
MAENKEAKPVRQRRREEPKKAVVHFTRAIPARVEEVIGRTGTRGEAIQVRCKILDGRDKNKIMRRNVKGPTQKGDILMLRETEIEARQLDKGGRAGGA